MYLDVLRTIVSVTLIREEKTAQYSMHHISKAIVPVEMRCPNIGKLSIALVIYLRNLIPYFQAHSIVVPTRYLLRQVLEKFKSSRRLTT